MRTKRVQHTCVCPSSCLPVCSLQSPFRSMTVDVTEACTVRLISNFQKVFCFVFSLFWFWMHQVDDANRLQQQFAGAWRRDGAVRVTHEIHGIRVASHGQFHGSLHSYVFDAHCRCDRPKIVAANIMCKYHETHENEINVRTYLRHRWCLRFSSLAIISSVRA